MEHPHSASYGDQPLGLCRHLGVEFIVIYIELD